MKARPKLRTSAYLSVAAHLLVLAVLVIHRPRHVTPIKSPGTALGTHVTLVYSPGQAAAQATLAAAKPIDTPLHLKQRTAPTNSASATADAAPNSSAGPAQGNNALGSGNVTVALATYFPWPRPDLSKLPRGSRGDVVVEVTIDEQGKIVTSQLAQSMGDSIDQLVLATIQTWTFKPATKDGIPVPSEQELLFHYEHT